MNCFHVEYLFLFLVFHGDNDGDEHIIRRRCHENQKFLLFVSSFCLKTNVFFFFFFFGPMACGL